MPIALKFHDPGMRFDRFKSVVIVPCQACPKMCLAVGKNSNQFLGIAVSGIMLGAWQ